MSLCEFELASVCVFDPASTLTESDVAAHRDQVVHRGGGYVHGSMLNCAVKVIVHGVVVNDMAFSKVRSLVT